MSRAMRLLLTTALVAASALGLSCNVNDYCLNCEKDAGGDGNHGDGGDGDGDNGDGIDAAGCATPQPEVCNNKDDDCDGNVDEGQLPTIGDLCTNQNGECAGGVNMCVNGAVRCSKPPMPESCDNKDNDCDGTPDDGDPEGGAKCGTDMGECVAGTFHCVNGVKTCQGAIGGTMPPFGSAEICDSKDNNCDGMVDNGAPPSGNPCAGNSNVGECKMGTPMCIGGNSVCIGAKGPTTELCDMKDQDCDGNVNMTDPNTNGFDLKNDPTNCGTCGTTCTFMNGFGGCHPVPPPNGMGTCYLVACDANYHNNDGNEANGCEFGPCTIQGNEVCNNVDDDCDGLKDGMDPDMQTPPVASLCRTAGECATGTTVTCDGANGFKCVYSDPDVTQTNGVIQAETLCDGKDNDCDGAIDEGQPGLNTACTKGQGTCQTSGMMVCDSNNLNGPAVCNAATPGMGTAETCDGKDNDCNGVVDDGATTGALTMGIEYVPIPGLTAQMMKYEASHPDATATVGGTLVTHACSRPMTQPWTNITYPQALAICNGMGARLCTEAEWQHSCLPDVPAVIDATALTTNIDDFVFVEAENAHMNTNIGGHPWNRIAPATFNGVTAMQVPDNGFSQTTAANALTQSSRLDFTVNTTASTPYRVWLRMRSPTVSTGPTLGTSTAATQTLSPISDATTAVGDLVIVTTYTTVNNNAAITHATQAGFTQITSQSTNDGNDDARMSIAYKVATAAGAQTYAAYTSSAGTSWSGITVVKPPYDLTAILSATANNTNDNNNPDPPSVGPVGSPSIVLAMAGWNLGATASNNTVTAPGSYTQAWEMGINATAELSVASRSVASGTTENPGTFGDSVSPLNTISATIAIGAGSSRSVWVGLNQGAAGAANGTFVTTAADDQWAWIVSPALTSSAAGGNHTFSIYLREDGVMIDQIAISRQATNSPTFDNVWAYETMPRTAQPLVCNGDEVDTALPVAIAASPNGASTSGGFATFTTTSPHRLSVGAPVTIAGVGVAGYNGNFTVASLISTTQFRVANSMTLANSGGGSANGDQDDMLATGWNSACHAEHGVNDIFDMSGNAKEWTQARTGGQNPLRGGSANNSVTGLTCRLNFTLADNTFFFPNVGFRCCKD